MAHQLDLDEILAFTIKIALEVRLSDSWEQLCLLIHATGWQAHPRWSS
jgi:hypothetical protein